MRLSEWREKAPNKELLSDEVLAVLRPAVVGLGAETDAECWIAWGDEPRQHYSILAPTVVGLIRVNVRPSDAEGPRAIARLIRWSKLTMTELGIDATPGRRVVGVQVEGLSLEGEGEEGDRICEFVRGLVAGIEGRSPAPVPIALVGGAAAGGAVTALPAAGQDAAGTAAAPARTAEPKPARKQPSAPSPKIVPISSKAASRSAGDAGVSPPPSPAEPLARPTAPGPAAPPMPPTPIAARAAAARRGEQLPTAPIHPVPDPEAESELIGLPPVEEPAADEPPKPRPWMP